MAVGVGDIASVGEGDSSGAVRAENAPQPVSRKSNTTRDHCRNALLQICHRFENGGLKASFVRLFAEALYASAKSLIFIKINAWGA